MTRLNVRQKWVALTVVLVAFGMALQLGVAYWVQRQAAEYGARGWFGASTTVGLSEQYRALLSELTAALDRIESTASPVGASREQMEQLARVQLGEQPDRRPFWAIVDDAGGPILTNEPACNGVVSHRVEGTRWRGGPIIGCERMAALTVYRHLDGEQGRGLVLGWIIDDAHAKWLSRSFNTEILFFVGNYQLGSSMAGGHGLVLTTIPRVSLARAVGAREMVFGSGSFTPPGYGGFSPADAKDRIPVGPDATWYYAVRHLESEEPVCMVLTVPVSWLMLGANYSTMTTSVISLVLLLLMGLLVWRLVGRYSAPLVALTSSAKAVTEGNLTQLVPEPRDPEMREFCRTYNHMIEAMREIVTLRQGHARAAGMADIASGIMHNIGNVLNSVNVSISQATALLEGSHLLSLEKLILLLTEHRDDMPGFLLHDPRGPKVLPFLQSLVEQLKSEQGHLATELAELTKSVDHIKLIVSSQQRYATYGGLVEPCSLKEIVEDALRIEAASFSNQGIEADCQLPELRLVCDRHRVMQIVVNLLSNAKQALRQTGSPRRVIVRAKGDEVGVRLFVEDNGCGIASAHREDVFRQGFTTKPDGHGIGLHNSALAARDMGGALSFESDGVGKGAIFTLELPRQRSRALRTRLHADGEAAIEQARARG